MPTWPQGVVHPIDDYGGVDGPAVFRVISVISSWLARDRPAIAVMPSTDAKTISKRHNVADRSRVVSLMRQAAERVSARATA